MSAMPLMLGVLCVMAIAYRYYSAFLASRVAVLDDSRTTPAIALNDGHNYHPTSKWVLFGHHFPAGSVLDFSTATDRRIVVNMRHADRSWIPPGATLRMNDGTVLRFDEGFWLQSSTQPQPKPPGLIIPPGAVRLVPGSSWGTFTI